MRLAIPLAFSLALSSWAAFAFAQTMPDPHEVFEDRCLACHGHAGGFVRDHLHLSDGTLVTSLGQPVGPFLKRHKGGLPEAQIAAMLVLFRQALTSGALYQQRCVFCHDRARDFARLTLTLRDDRLTGRYSGHDTASFLQGHARLTQEEARAMLAILRGFLDAPP